ncbi:hypothetical protein QA584_01295 [Anaerocolumna sp. AGMB13025]|uniref:hypothetical protein n=1 Tax=Anaerocolumna sp. AGMB13025 TaxID=3039116 RepID=UPI00241E1141|nr:hypothetical protein [Anaerocolumna sp. AGMB13025]WFR57745.1 hypothetical protein QA584_01295 [Anaerocolumna sp. AGMB13025]
MLRKPILMNKLNKEKSQGKLVIGLIGTHTGAGVTHLGILLAVYLSECLGHKTAFIECGGNNDLKHLQEHFFHPEEEQYNQESFTLNRVTFHKNKRLQGLPEIIGDKYDCVILDLGTDLAKHKSEFLRCDKKIVIGSLAVWKTHELEKFINITAPIKNCEQWIYAIPFATKKTVREAEKKYKRIIQGVPYEPDPFLLTGNIIRLFQKLI